MLSCSIAHSMWARMTSRTSDNAACALRPHSTRSSCRQCAAHRHHVVAAAADTRAGELGVLDLTPAESAISFKAVAAQDAEILFPKIRLPHVRARPKGLAVAVLASAGPWGVGHLGRRHRRFAAEANRTLA